MKYICKKCSGEPCRLSISEEIPVFCPLDGCDDADWQLEEEEG